MWADNLKESAFDMPCCDALIEPVIMLDENDTFDHALSVLNDHNIRSAPVVNDQGVYMGMFSLRSTFIALLPVAITMEGGLDNVDFVIGASPGIAKKLKKIGSRKIGEHLDHGIVVGHMETPLLEIMRLIIKQGSPVPVVDRKTGKFEGLVSEQSILATFTRLQEVADNRTSHLSPEDVALLKEFGVLN